MDVNTYLDKLVSRSTYFENKGNNQLSSTILFVDPYCFGEVKIKKIKNFTDKFYSELIFNYFNSDYRRNIDNTKTPTKRQKIIDSMDGILGYNPSMDEKQVEELIKNSIKGKYIKHSFSYPFRIKTNVELYHIIYATLNVKGLMKIKESLWDVFNGDIFFKNGYNQEQISFFDDTRVKEMNIQNFSSEAQEYLCFTTDSFMYKYDDISNLSIEILKLVNSYNIPCTALTKGVLPKELANLSKDNSYGITLISLNEEFRKQMEPGSAPYKDRIASLKYLHDNGCKTWVSIEPYPTPNFIEQDFDEILKSISFTDKIIFGRLHYNKKVSEYKDYKKYYNELAYKVIDFCKKNNIEYHIKNKTITEEK